MAAIEKTGQAQTRTDMPASEPQMNVVSQQPKGDVVKTGSVHGHTWKMDDLPWVHAEVGPYVEYPAQVLERIARAFPSSTETTTIQS